MQLNPIIKVSVQRAEGLTHFDDFNKHEFTGQFAEQQADEFLAKLSQSAPGRTEGYHKCDVVVEEENGDSYCMCFCLVNYKNDTVGMHLSAMKERVERLEKRNPPTPVRQQPPPPPAPREDIKRVMQETKQEMNVYSKRVAIKRAMRTTLHAAGFTNEHIEMLTQIPSGGSVHKNC